MKILLISEYFYPQTAGGTELYVYNLAKGLIDQKHSVEILTVTANLDDTINQYQKIPIHYILCNQHNNKTVISGQQPANNLAEFISKIIEINADVIHFHTVTTSISKFHIQAAKKAGFKTVLTSHIVSHTCIRGNLMQSGENICDGKVEQQKCLSCYLQYRHIKKPYNYAISKLITSFNFPESYSKLPFRKLTELKVLNDNLDSIIVASEWQRKVFLKNSFSFGKIKLVRQAIELVDEHNDLKESTQILKIGFIGRLTPAKGLHVLLDAIESLATKSVQLYIAVQLVNGEEDYAQKQKRRAENLSDTIWITNMPNKDVAAFIQNLDIVCLPSQIPETGPFVAYEALAQHVPVLGSKLGGLEELIITGKNGWLFPHKNVHQLAGMIASFIDQKQQGILLKNVAAIHRPISMLADEMIAIYQSL